MPPVSLAAIRSLREKYERMHLLREAHDRAGADASFVEPDPARAMAELAARFPGSLREIDVLPLATIRARIETLTRVEERADAIQTWMVAQVCFHQVMRGALKAKRWLAGRREVTDAMAAQFSELAAVDADAAVVAADLGAIARPPRGRLTEYACAKVAAIVGADIRSVKAEVLPTRR